MAVNTVYKVTTWVIRFIQLCFAIIMTGIFSWFIHENREVGWPVPSEEIVPLVFSVLAIFFTTFSIFAVFLGKTAIYVAAFLDFVIFVGYCVSAGLYGSNFHVHGYDNPLQGYLIDGRIVLGWSVDYGRIDALVKLGAALIIMQIIFFFFTIVLSFLLARDIRRDTNTAEAAYVGNEKRGLFGRRSRHADPAANPAV